MMITNSALRRVPIRIIVEQTIPRVGMGWWVKATITTKLRHSIGSIINRIVRPVKDLFQW